MLFPFILHSEKPSQSMSLITRKIDAGKMTQRM
jgi:hypothetical protein